MLHALLALVLPGLQATVVVDRIEGDVAIVEFVSDGSTWEAPAAGLVEGKRALVNVDELVRL